MGAFIQYLITEQEDTNHDASLVNTLKRMIRFSEQDSYSYELTDIKQFIETANKIVTEELKSLNSKDTVKQKDGSEVDASTENADAAISEIVKGIPYAIQNQFGLSKGDLVIVKRMAKNVGDIVRQHLDNPKSIPTIINNSFDNALTVTDSNTRKKEKSTNVDNQRAVRTRNPKQGKQFNRYK